MTLSPHREPLVFHGLDDVYEAIRRAGGRRSTARRVVLEALFAADGPVSAEYIADGLGGRIMRSDVSSVYRNLQHLEELGIVRHVHVGHGPGLYALEVETPREYLVCERCDRVDTVPAPRLDRVRDEVRAEVGYEVRFGHFPLVGLCATCAQSTDAGPRRSSLDGEAGDEDEHRHPHSHEHAHGGALHAHPHTEHGHEHTEHEHEHSHGDHAHSHPHVHEKGLEEDHAHSH